MVRLAQDLRLALRQLRRSPGFTLTAVLMLGLGIGATTAIFTLVYDVLLKPLPYAHPERLAVMEEVVAEFRNFYPTLPLNANHFAFWQQHAKSIDAMVIADEDSIPLGAGGHPLQVEVVRSTPGLFRVLDAAPELGRAFTAEEDQPGHERVVVLMHDLWQRQFSSDPAILGKTITLNGYTYTVIGVMPRGFHLPDMQAAYATGAARRQPIQALLPMALSKDRLEEAMGDFNYFGLARLKPGISVAQANAELNALQHTITAGLSAEDHATLSAALTPFQQSLVGDNRKPLLILLAAVAALLLVGCVNIANLLLARAVGQRQQLAIAAALGASRAELLRAGMRETLVLAGAGGLLGIGLATAIVPIMQRYLPPALDFRGPLHLDWAGAGCALLLAAGATLLAGAAPAWINARTEPGEVLHSEARLASESRSSKRLRRVLVAAEVAVSVALVVVTGLLIASLVRLMQVHRGFEAERTVTATLDLPYKAYPELENRTPFYTEVLERVRHLPGVEHAAIVSSLPLAGDGWIDMARVPGESRPFMQIPAEHFRWTSPDYLQAIHLPLVSGRWLTAGDEGRNYAMVSDLTAKTLWPGKNPIGQQFRRGDPHDPKQLPFTVIGVVADARTITLAKPDPMMIYVPYWYRNELSAGLVVRTQMDPGAMADAIRGAIWSVDPAVSVPTVRLFGGVVADSTANRRFEMDLLLVFAASALLLAGLGVYGVVTYSVVQRQREIGLRLALGAPQANIYRLVLRDGLLPVLAGVPAGLAIAFAFARLLRSLLFEVSPYNLAVSSGAIVVLLGVGVLACLLPARRAASVDPMRALRSE
jgi:predicted permease